MADEFDMSFFQDKALDHGCFSPLSVLCDRDGGQWPVPIVPLQMGVLQVPVPSLICRVEWISVARNSSELVMFSALSVRCSPMKASW